MKTLAVLSALATIAFTAPTIENYADSTRLMPRDFIIPQREKKSAMPQTQKENSDDHIMEQVLNKAESNNPDARTFSSLKKPIIVQKKIGYHVSHYRNSDEEQSQADSQELCRKQMKVQLCDDNNSNGKRKSASLEHEEKSEREMVRSINIAKEAVQTFEKDLQRMENECAETNKHRHTTFGSDIELQQDIEKAREALEHIHRKFKNFDSMTTKNEENSEGHPKILKSDEERRNQWKDAGKVLNNVEIGRNLEDNFKNTDEGDQLNHNKLNEFNTNGVNKHLKTIIEDIDKPLRSNDEFQDGMTSIIEDKNRKLKIHSDSLIKATTVDEGQQKHETSRMEHQALDHKDMTDKNVEMNHSETQNHQEIEETKDRAIEDKDSKLKLEEMKEESLKSTNDDARTNLDKGSEKAEFHAELSHHNDQMMDGIHHVHSMSKMNSKANTNSEEVKTVHNEVSTQNDKNLHVNHLEQRTKNTEFINREPLHTEESKKDIPGQISLEHPLKEQTTENHNLKSKHEMNVDTQGSSTMTNLRVHNEKDTEKTLLNNADTHANNDLALLRATSDFHKELLNNMDFIEDSHHTALHQSSLTNKNQMMKNEKQELHERLSVPEVHPNSDHLKTMMHFSDNPHVMTPHMKMASMFNNEDDNLNVEINSPQEFVEQTNVQELLPFRTTGDLHDTMVKDERLKPIHDNEGIPTLRNPLTVHRAHVDNMKMDGSSQHFNIEQLSPVRNNPMHHHHHPSFNEQLMAQQKWAQAKSASHPAMNTGFEHLHVQDAFGSRNGHNMMMHEKSSTDNTMQPFMQMRGTPKMSGSNQWAHNNDAFRSSYGPSLSSSYGSGSYGGSAVGLFPNANVGNCAVPILLSCSPSVVSGTLSKSSYSAPSYRSEDSNMHKKRGANVGELKQ